MSVNALAAHRLRTALALSSVGAGVAAVILSSAVGAGAQRDVERRISAMGANLLVVRPAQVKRFVARKEIRGTATTLRLDDYRAILALPLVVNAAPTIEGAVRLKSTSVIVKTMIVGTTAAFPLVRRFELRTGRFFDDDDDLAARRVAVLGARVADALFDVNPVGTQIRIGGIAFDVIGVLRPKGVQADGDEDNQVLVPVRTALRRVFNTTWLSSVLVTARDKEGVATAASEIVTTLTQRHGATREGQPDFEVQNVSRLFALQQQATSSLRGLTTGLAAIALCIGGTGIMALMLLQVKARTSEIGLRVAVGARPRDILAQFLAEAVLLALGGWLAGVFLGAVGAVTVAVRTTWPIVAPIPAVAASFTMAVLMGLGFGAMPARRASMIPAVRALSSQ
ncbi:MAG: ABC transporter permease [bacterium]